MGGKLLSRDQSSQVPAEPAKESTLHKDLLFLDPSGKIKKGNNQKTNLQGQIYTRENLTKSMG